MMVIALMLPLCACGDADDALDLVKQAMRKRDQTRNIWSVYVMRYTGRAWLTDKPLTENKAVYDQIPENGTVIIMEGFGLHNKQLFFFDETGSLALCEDDQTLNEECERTHQTVSRDPTWVNLDRYTAAVEISIYFGNIALTAYSDTASKDEGVPSSMESNVWYKLSEKQLKKVLN